MLITFGGQIGAHQCRGYPEAGRNTEGVKLINLDPTDKLQAIAPVITEKDEEVSEVLLKRSLIIPFR